MRKNVILVTNRKYANKDTDIDTKYTGRGTGTEVTKLH